jgi:hypothetical protein
MYSIPFNQTVTGITDRNSIELDSYKSNIKVRSLNLGMARKINLWKHPCYSFEIKSGVGVYLENSEFCRKMKSFADKDERHNIAA